MQENYRTGMVDPATRVDAYLGRHRRTETGGKRRREVPCTGCSGIGHRFVPRVTCSICGGSGLVPAPARTDPTTYRGTHAARSTR